MRGYRFMRLVVMFDLPTQTSADRKAYRQFRKSLLEMGFIMLQESVYHKLLLNHSIASQYENKLEKVKPKKGLVYSLLITEKQFCKMKVLVGEYQTDRVINSDERLIIL